MRMQDSTYVVFNIMKLLNLPEFPYSCSYSPLDDALWAGSQGS